jgi:tetratricopeptide (TPR) repeat protein
MSLLIKALDKAEKAQEEQQLKLQKETRRRAGNIANNDEVESKDGLHLELEQPQKPKKIEGSSSFDEEADIARAANIFEAKQYANTGVNPLLWIAGLALIALLGTGYYFYAQLNNLGSQPLVLNQPMETGQSDQSTSPQDSTIQQNIAADQIAIFPAKESESEPSVEPPKAPVIESERAEPKPESAKAVLAANEEEIDQPTQESSVNIQAVARRHDATMSFGAPIASESASIQISRSKTEQGVNPALLSAYNAYNAGNDKEALALYKSVLQRDIRNVDGLLGMGAIAERQGRQSDALGWFRKVLEVEPRNAIALSAFYDHDLEGQNKELKFKNLIAKNPNDFNAHADLGSYYAEQSRWADAQQSYFEAYRLNATADNAYNLAVSLDQMRKPKLALPYYQQALDLINKSPTYSFDQSIVQTRIRAIQDK